MLSSVARSIPGSRLRQDDLGWPWKWVFRKRSADLPSLESVSLADDELEVRDDRTPPMMSQGDGRFVGGGDLEEDGLGHLILQAAIGAQAELQVIPAGRQLE